jgi:hypothetical protein
MCSHQENVKKNIKTSKRPKGMGQVVGHYPTKLEALIYPNTTKKKKRQSKKSNKVSRTEHASQPDRDRAGILTISDLNLKQL